MIKKILYPALLLAAMACSKQNGAPPEEPEKPQGDVKFMVTTCNQLYLFDEDAVNFTDDVAPFTIRLDTLDRRQPVEGFGAALTGSSAYLLKQMDAAKRAALLKELFDPEDGIGISYLRITIGSSDFSLSYYTYCDVEDINSFRIPDTDRRDLLPVLKEILAINPGIRIMATPWTPPVWMKTTGQWSGGSLKPEYYDEYAQYFVKYIKEMSYEGITIDAISVQNEPMWEFGTPGMKMTWQEQRDFIKNNLGPLLASEEIKTKILIWDHNWDMPEYPINILNDPDAAKYITGSAFHGYNGNYTQMSDVYNAHPDKKLYFTEISGGGWAVNFSDNLKWNVTNVFLGTLSCRSGNVLMWNLVLTDSWGPYLQGGCSNCRGVITLNADGSTKRDNEYYAIAHFSKYIRPDAYIVGTTVTGSSPDASQFKYIAAQNKDNSKVLVAMNLSASPAKMAVRCGTKKFIYTIQGESLVTFYWK
jgi:glucosylceramidase